MSVLLETSLGDIVVDLYTETAPVTCTNFLKLCKVKAYNWALFFNVQNGYAVQCGPASDALAGRPGSSIWGLLEGPHRALFESEDSVSARACNNRNAPGGRRGLLAMVVAGRDSLTGDSGLCAAHFIFTLGKSPSLDNKISIFGEIAEGHDVLDRLESLYVDSNGRPYQDTLVNRTIVLEDPFPDPIGLKEPDASPPAPREITESARQASNRTPGTDFSTLTDGNTNDVISKECDEPEAVEARAKAAREREAKGNALALEMLGDLPSANVRPPENVLFVCKINPVTQDEDLRQIFGRFGALGSCEIIRDRVTGDSLSYAFIEYDERASCEAAYFKMNNVLIDDRRIKVDFSQSVARLHSEWSSTRQVRTSIQNPKTTHNPLNSVGGIAGLTKRTQYRTGNGRSKDESVGQSNSKIKSRGVRQYPMLFEHGTTASASDNPVASKRRHHSFERRSEKHEIESSRRHKNGKRLCSIEKKRHHTRPRSRSRSG